MAQRVNIKHHMNAEEQKELFLWKYRDVERCTIGELYKDFQKFSKGKGEITEHEAILMLEYRGEAKTHTEFRSSIASMLDASKSHHLSFLELCCAFFNKSFEDLHDFADEESRAAAMAEARQMEGMARAAEKEIELAKAEEEAAARKRAEELEMESKMTGVAGMRAFFHRQAEESSDHSLTNEQKIKMEASRRKTLREAKMRLNAALEEASKVRTAEEMQKEMAMKALKAAAEAAAEAASVAEAERAARAARKAALNAKWGAGLPPPPMKKSVVNAPRSPTRLKMKM